MDTTTRGRSRLGLGLAAVARPAYITSGRDRDLGPARDVAALRERTWTLLDAAYDGGIRYLDVARSYGRAEEFLAGWLAARSAPDVVIGSKWGYRYVGDWRLEADVHEVKDHSQAAFAEQWELTRALLGDRLAIYHVHSLTPDSPALTDRDLHRSLAELLDQGVRVGFSTSGPDQPDVIRRGLDVTVDGRPLFTSIQATWNLLESSAGPALAEAADRGVTVIIKEALANGRLTSAAPDPATDVARELARQLSADGPIGGSAGSAGSAGSVGGPVGVDQVAIGAALAQPWAWRVLSGAVTTGQLAQNLAGEQLDLDPGTLSTLTASALPPGQYWSERASRSWS
jgi:aryl-alcohol dehydrogenase-like predicted oxidoreductase